MAHRFEIRIEWDPQGYYVATVPQIPDFRVEGPSPDGLAVELSEALREAFRLDDPGDGSDIMIVRSDGN